LYLPLLFRLLLSKKPKDSAFFISKKKEAGFSLCRAPVARVFIKDGYSNDTPASETNYENTENKDENNSGNLGQSSPEEPEDPKKNKKKGAVKHWLRHTRRKILS